MDFRLEHAQKFLKGTPSTLNALLRDLPEPWLVQNEEPETWSPYDVVGHLIHGEETDWIPRAKIILEHGEPEPSNHSIVWRCLRILRVGPLPSYSTHSQSCALEICESSKL